MDSQVSPKKSIFKKWWFWVIAVIVLFVIIGSVNSSPSKIGSTSSTPAQTVFKVGDQIKEGNTVLTVTSVKKNWISSNQFDKPQNPGNAYVLVSVEIQNTGSDTLDLSSMFDFKLEDGSGAIRDQAIGGVGINSLSSVGSIASGGKASGQLLFEAGKDSLDKLTLHYDPTFSSGKEVTIELQ